ncbi:MAG: response regulator, partial [Myxococcales bacterium]|nr:response regulator [Myxococcales bacterium]
GVAHDFNNLLTVIQANVAMLIDGDEALPEADRPRALGDIAHAAARATELTRDLLAVGRRQMMQPQPVDLNALVSRLTTLLRALLGESRRLVLALDARAAPFVRADPAQLERVLVNLVANARDATPAGGVVTLATADGDDDTVRLSVSDTGVGMEPAVAERIFEPFYTTKGPGSGVGLGLATVQGIIVQSGGSLRVETSPGRGATFHVTLPVALAPAQGAGGGAQPTPEAAAARGLRLLVVEDEDPVRHIVVVALRRGGHEVVAAPSAEEALVVWAREGGRFDLLVTDLSLTGQSGAELASILRREAPTLPVLFISGHAYEAQEAVARQAGRAACLPKPFAPEALRAALRALVEAHDGA